MRRTILIVDDNSACAEPLQMALESLEGMDVRLVANAAEALDILSRESSGISAVITDLRMPLVSGLELLEAIKQSAAFCSVPVIVVSGDSDPGLSAQVFKSGAVGFFTKPYSPLEVKRHLEQLLV